MIDTRSILKFLEKVTTNNNREWLANNKNEYEKTRETLYELTQNMIDQLSTIDETLIGVRYQECTYRFYRDIRFSPDKRPYKEYYSAYIAPGGRTSLKAGYYIHIQPGGQSLIGGGIHTPPSNLLKIIRKDIAINGEEIQEILENPKFKKIFGELKGEKLKKAPKEYSPQHPFIELLKLKSYDAIHIYQDDQFIKKSKQYMNDMIEKFTILKPLNDYFNAVLQDYI